MRRLAILVLAGSAFAGAAFATSPADQTQQASATQTAPLSAGQPPPPKADPMICKWSEEIGTRLGNHRICHTKSEWAQISRDAQDQLEDSLRRADEGAPPGH